MIPTDRFLREMNERSKASRAPELIRDYFLEAVPQGVDLPPRFTAPAADKYARHLLARFDNGATAIVMVWGRGQGTPLHDHGMWCVEGVWRGRIEVVRYDVLEENGDDFRFRKGETLNAELGSAGALIPPTDYHTIANNLTAPSITIHIYADEMDMAHVFLPAGGDRYRRERKSLTYTTCEPLLG